MINMAKIDLHKYCVVHFDGEVIAVYDSYESAKKDFEGVSFSYDPLYSFFKVRCYSTKRLNKLFQALQL